MSGHKCQLILSDCVSMEIRNAFILQTCILLVAYIIMRFIENNFKAIFNFVSSVPLSILGFIWYYTPMMVIWRWRLEYIEKIKEIERVRLELAKTTKHLQEVRSGRVQLEAYRSGSEPVHVEKIPSCQVTITVEREDGQRVLRGQGFRLDQYLVTAAHVLADYEEFYISGANPDEVIIVSRDVFILDPDLDLAYAPVTRWSTIGVTTARVPKALMSVCPVSVTAGNSRVSEVAYRPKMSQLWVFNGSTFKGWSGAPYLCGDKTVIGMHLGAHNLNFGIDALFIKRILSRRLEHNQRDYDHFEALLKELDADDKVHVRLLRNTPNLFSFIDRSGHFQDIDADDFYANRHRDRFQLYNDPLSFAQDTHIQFDNVGDAVAKGYVRDRFYYDSDEEEIDFPNHRSIRERRKNRKRATDFEANSDPENFNRPAPVSVGPRPSPRTVPVTPVPSTSQESLGAMAHCPLAMHQSMDGQRLHPVKSDVVSPSTVASPNKPQEEVPPPWVKDLLVMMKGVQSSCARLANSKVSASKPTTTTQTTQ